MKERTLMLKEVEPLHIFWPHLQTWNCFNCFPLACEWWPPYALNEGKRNSHRSQPVGGSAPMEKKRSRQEFRLGGCLSKVSTGAVVTSFTQKNVLCFHYHGLSCLAHRGVKSTEKLYWSMSTVSSQKRIWVKVQKFYLVFKSKQLLSFRNQIKRQMDIFSFKLF